MKRQDKIFRNAMMLFAAIECAGVFCDLPVFAEVGVVGIMVTGLLWLWFGASDNVVRNDRRRQARRAVRR